MSRMNIEERRAALVDAALRVIARDGVAAASTRAIAAEAGMPLASFHYAFESRDALLRAAVVKVTDIDYGHAEAGFHSIITDPALFSEVSLEELIRLTFDAYLESLVNDPGREQAMLELSLSSMRNPSLEHLPAEQYATYYQSALRVMAEWEEVAGITWSMPTTQIAQAVVIVLDGITTNWLATRDTESVRATLPGFAAMFAAIADTNT